MYFIQQKVSKGIDPPQVLSPDMVPPSERGTPIPVSSCWPPLRATPVVLVLLPTPRHQVALAVLVGGVCLCCPDGSQAWGWRWMILSLNSKT